MMENPPSDEAQAALYDITLHVYRYARRFTVGQSTSAEDAIIYDACISTLNQSFAPKRLGSSETESAVHDRYDRYGAEPVTGKFTLPVAAADAVVILHRLARRYTNGRGTYTAALVNAAAKQLLALGIPLDETRILDGTIWAADGVGGQYDTLTPDQRAEALATLRSPRAKAGT